MELNIEKIKNLKTVKNIVSRISQKQDKTITLAGICQGIRDLFYYRLIETQNNPIIIITGTPQRAEEVYRNIQFYNPTKPFFYFPQEEKNINTEGIRAQVADNFPKKGNKIITTIQSIFQEIQDPDFITSKTLTLTKGQEINQESLLKFLVNSGYQNHYLVEEKGQFSQRGFIVDVFPPYFLCDTPVAGYTENMGVRIEFWDEEIETIRFFDPQGQSSFTNIDSIKIPPLITIEHCPIYLQNLLPDNSIIIMEEPNQLKLKYLQNKGELGNWEAFISFLEKFKILKITSWEDACTDKTSGDLDLNCINPPLFNCDIGLFVNELKKWQKEKYSTFIITSNPEGLSEILIQRDIPGIVKEIKCDDIKGKVILINGTLKGGFELKGEKIILLTDYELFSKTNIQPLKVSHKKSINLLDPFSLKPGDFVVHELYGISRFLALRTILSPFKDIKQECLLLEFKNGDLVYLPISQMELITKYSSLEGKAPKLSPLSKKKWQKTKTDIRQALKEEAERIISINAQRFLKEGHAFSKDSPWCHELAMSFPYEETPDQIKAIRDINSDMENPSPMDRLLLGDAGYGKTEVSVRAAFKAIMNGKQVALLAPTTILAEQHYHTFSARFQPFGVELKVLSRVVTEKEQGSILKQLKDGQIDMIIATHRLLNKDILFKDLGLLIIDEEQLFGVIQKHLLIERYPGVDLLTMSATPIPRTLYMSLINLKDLSLISTPPKDRIPIKTYLYPFDKEIIIAAIQNEIERGGQVYFLHNRIAGITGISAKLQNWLPELKIAICHGRMDERELSSIILDFSQGKYDILVSTTIIGSGIDIPNVNTIIINNAQNFGLSQLYQIRGRVGRSTRQGYAFLFYPQDTPITEIALKRLNTICELTKTGSGFELAQRDLEIRGTGNLLGIAQHGFINTVGYELYKQLLGEAILELKGKPKTSDDVEAFSVQFLNMPFACYLPSDFISDEKLKLSYYKKASNFKDLEEINVLRKELADIFGRLPKEAENFIKLLRIKVLMAHLKIQFLRYNEEQFIFPFANDPNISETLQKGKEIFNTQLKYYNECIMIDTDNKDPEKLLLKLEKFLIYLIKKRPKPNEKQ